jgi:predicted transposase/invertase (TIGR01784 family)
MSEGYVKAYSDIFIKYLFGKEGNEDILLDFINDVLTDEGFPKVKSVEVKNPFNIKRFAIDKESYLDLKVVDENGKRYNIEVQSVTEKFFINRILYYWSRLYTSQMEEGDLYSKLKPTISIDVLNFELLKDNNKLHNLAYLALKDKPTIALSDLLFIHLIELPKIFKHKKRIEDMTDLERWVYFFINEGKEDADMEVLIKNDEVLSKAHSEYDRFVLDDDLREIYEMRVEGERISKTRIETAKEEGIKKGRKEGLQKGQKEKQRQIAKKMLEKGLDIKLIIEVTGLSEEEIKKLRG